VLTRVNDDLVDLVRPDHDALEELRWLIERYVGRTGSRRGRELLDTGDRVLDQLWHVLPRERVQRISTTAATRVSAA
jgi:glutamate synthase domain-containing protein 3